MFCTEIKRTRRLLAVTIVTLAIFQVACNKQQKPTETQSQGGPKTFASPNDAGKAVVEAAKTDNREAMLAIFDAGSKDIIYSGDTSEDKEEFAGFVSDYDAMHRWRKLDNGSELLITGTDNKTFPIPLKKNDDGQWYFHTATGKQEILARRIGRNEMAAIDVCAAIADAQKQYFSTPHYGAKQHAQKFISDEGQQNGLYWPSAGGQPKSPLGPLVAFATSEGFKVKPDSHQPFHGYYFQMLDKQGADAKGGAMSYIVNDKMTGGFAVLAYPAQYGDSGVLAFIINQNGVVLEKDLGKTTNEVAAAIAEFNPDRSWKAVDRSNGHSGGRAVVWKSGKGKCANAGHLCGTQTAAEGGVSSELKFPLSRPSPAFAQCAVTITGDTP